jgi:hypothetical protein
MHLYNCIWVILLISRLNLAFLSPKLSHGIDKVLVCLCPYGFDNPRNTLRWKLLQLASVRIRIILFDLRTANKRPVSCFVLTSTSTLLAVELPLPSKELLLHLTDHLMQTRRGPMPISKQRPTSEQRSKPKRASGQDEDSPGQQWCPTRGGARPCVTWWWWVAITAGNPAAGGSAVVTPPSYRRHSSRVSFMKTGGEGWFPSKPTEDTKSEVSTSAHRCLYHKMDSVQQVNTSSPFEPRNALFTASGG